MSQTKLHIFILLRIIIIVSEVSSWNDASAFYGLQNIDFFRKRFGPVKMLSHTVNPAENEDGEVNEIALKNEDEINEAGVIEKDLNDEDTGIVHKDSMPSLTPDDPIVRKEKGFPPVRPKKHVENHSKKNCWMDANAKEHFELMDGIDERYASVRTQYQEAAEKDNFSKDMLDMMIKTRGVAHRAVHKAKGDPSFIPAGINLGGHGMLRLDDSILFFHRMKLRNNTHFRVISLQNDLANMVLTAKMSLNDLHILGAYERATTLSDPVQLFYTPTFGEAEFLLKNVEYNMEGRYRMLRDKLAIELIISDIKVNDILLTYQNNKKDGKSVMLERKNIDEFVDRLKIDLDKWLKDYFNDYLMYFGLVGEKANAKFIEYNKEKTNALNEYTERMLEKLDGRIRELKLCAVRLPEFSVTTVNGMHLKLTRGVLRGLESIHRRSLATGKRENKLRKVNAIVGFSSLKATYQYEAVFNTGVPPINGMLVVTADEIIAHFGLTLTEDHENGDLLFDSIQQLKPESLTLEGPANRIIGNFKNILERHVFTFISNAIIHNIIMLRTLTKCEPLLYSIHLICEDEEEEEENNRKISKPPPKDDEIEKKTTDNNDSSLKNASSEINGNTSDNNQTLEEPQNEQKNNSVLPNGAEENNEESTPKKTLNIEVEIVKKDKAKVNRDTNIGSDTNNDKATIDNTGINRGLESNNDTGNYENVDENTEKLKGLDSSNNEDGNEGNSSSVTNKKVKIEIVMVPDAPHISGDNAETNRNLDTNNAEENNDRE